MLKLPIKLGKRTIRKSAFLISSDKIFFAFVRLNSIPLTDERLGQAVTLKLSNSILDSPEYFFRL